MRRSVPAPRDGVVTRVGALAVGIAALELGAGRRTKADAIDHSVGVLCFAKRGDAVLEGDDLAEVHARDEASAAAAAEAILAAYTIADEAPPERGIVLDVVSLERRQPRPSGVRSGPRIGHARHEAQGELPRRRVGDHARPQPSPGHSEAACLD